MASTPVEKNVTYIRSGSFIKDYFIKFLTALFVAEERGIIKFFDGTKQIKFSRRPDVVKSKSWDFRNVPAVLITGVSGNYTQFLTKDLINTPDVSDSEQVNVWGGDIELNASLSIRATTLEERDKLTDVVGVYLSHPDCKDYFGQQSLRLPNPPRVSEGGSIPEPNIDHPIYENTISMDVIGTWRAEEAIDDRLLDIIVEITAELDFDDE